MPRPATALPALVLIACSTVLHAQSAPPPKTPTIDQSLEAFNVFSPKISPDGTRVIYEQSRTNWEANAFDTELWIANVATGARHPLSQRGSSSSDAAWSPDGRWIAFLSDRPASLKDSPSGKRQLYLMPADSGDAQQITKMENGINSFEWAPDSRRIALAAQGPEPKAMKDRKESFGDYNVIHADYRMTHLWLVDVPIPDQAGRIPKLEDPKLLTKGDDFSIDGSFSFSPDG